MRKKQKCKYKKLKALKIGSNDLILPKQYLNKKRYEML